MKITATQQDAYNLFHDGMKAFAQATQNGMRVDLDYCRDMQKQLDKDIAEIEQQMSQSKFVRKWQHRYGNKFNPLNNYQLSNMLYKVEKIEPPVRTESGKGSVNDEALQQLEVNGLDLVLRMRKLDKIKSTFLNGLLTHQVRGYVHPFFNLHTTVTYRSSSTDPNFQNIPKRDKEARKIIRRAIYARPGHQLLEVDYSGIEVRVAACYHEDPRMIEYIEDPASDMHGDMAAQIFFLEDQFDKAKEDQYMLRQAAKNSFVFPQFYGDYYKGCAENLCNIWLKLPKANWRPGSGVDMPSLGMTMGDWLRQQGIRSYDAFEEHIRKIEDDFWNRRFSAYQRWKDRWWQEYQRSGQVRSLTGFRYEGVLNKKNVINYPIQGSAFHCLLWSFTQLTKIFQEQGFDTRLIGQIHDAIILDVHPKELDEVKELLRIWMVEELKEHWQWINVPIDIDADLGPVDGSWYELEGVQL
jgi:DNA polymerase-1